jgi:hypothetical protein
MTFIAAAIIVLVVQIILGAAKAYAAKKAYQATANNDLLAEVTVGNGTVKVDKSDILAVAFVVFVFWAVGIKDLDVKDALTSFVVVLSGTGVKKLIQALYPSAQA